MSLFDLLGGERPSHYHWCSDCGRVWSHDPDALDDYETYRSEHTCCGKWHASHVRTEREAKSACSERRPD